MFHGRPYTFRNGLTKLPCVHCLFCILLLDKCPHSWCTQMISTLRLNRIWSAVTEMPWTITDQYVCHIQDAARLRNFHSTYWLKLITHQLLWECRQQDLPCLPHHKTWHVASRSECEKGCSKSKRGALPSALHCKHTQVYNEKCMGNHWRKSTPPRPLYF